MPASRIYASGSARQKIKGAVKVVVTLRFGNRMSSSMFLPDAISRFFNSYELLNNLAGGSKAVARSRAKCASPVSGNRNGGGG